MKITLSWLSEYLSAPVVDLESVVVVLERMGLECEGSKNWRAMLGQFIVGEIMEAEKHPNADTLQVCKVYNGKEILQIVCGASNARKGIKVVISPVGVTIPLNGMVIKNATIRGVDSCGMLCSAKELGISDDHNGIIELPHEAITGDSPAKWLMDELVVDLSVTPNMHRVMSIMGMAREFAVFSGNVNFVQKKAAELRHNYESPIRFTIENREICKFISGIYVKNVNNKVKVPSFIKQRLSAVGISSISPIVDIVNYCFHEIGQPMHVYNADAISGNNLRVLQLSSDCDFVALDNTKYDIKAGVSVISDDLGAACIAGVIGGKRTACNENTRNIFLEAALFNKDYVHGTQIRTSSRARFERFVDDECCASALVKAAAMIVDICGGEASNIVIDGSIDHKRKNLAIDLQYLCNISGCQFCLDDVEKILRALGIVTHAEGNTVQCALPSWMADMESQADLAEGVLKIVGYDSIASVKFCSPGVKQKVPYEEIRSAMALSGYCDTMTWSFIGLSEAELFSKDLLIIKNPISDTMRVMRPSILPGMLSAVSRNVSRGIDVIAISEVGPVYSCSNDRTIMAAAIRCGLSCERNIFSTSRRVDIFDVKADLFAILSHINPNLDLDLISLDGRASDVYHPSQSAKIEYDGKLTVGYIGALHPRVIEKFGIKKVSVVAMELDCDVIVNLSVLDNKNKSHTFSKFQQVQRDFAFIVNDTTKAQTLIDVIKDLKIAIIKEIKIFDVYKGEKIGVGQQSIAFSLIAQADDRTLSESEINNMSDKIIDAITLKLDGKIRDAIL